MPRFERDYLSRRIAWVKRGRNCCTLFLAFPPYRFPKELGSEYLLWLKPKPINGNVTNREI